MSLSIALGTILSLLAAVYVDWWRKTLTNQEIYVYSSLFLLGFIAGMIGVYFQSTIPESRMVIEKDKPDLLNMLLMPFRDGNFRRLISFSGSWNFAVNLAAPFFTVYMLKRLQLDMSLVILLLVISQITNVFFLRIWGRFVDRFSNKSVLGVCGPLFILCILAWTFTTLPEKHFATIPLLIVIHMFLGLSTAGVTLASGNIGLKLSPKGYATAYLAANSVISQLAAGMGPLLGGTFADFFESRELSLIINWKSPVREMALSTLSFQHWDFFFFFAFLIGLFSINRLTKVKEVGEVEERIVIHELVSEVRREMRNLSTVGGLRHMAQFPFHLLRSALKMD